MANSVRYAILARSRATNGGDLARPSGNSNRILWPCMSFAEELEPAWYVICGRDTKFARQFCDILKSGGRPGAPDGRSGTEPECPRRAVRANDYAGVPGLVHCAGREAPTVHHRRVRGPLPRRKAPLGHGQPAADGRPSARSGRPTRAEGHGRPRTARRTIAAL